MNNLQDTFGRTHDYLRISLTEKCNLRCTYCMPEHGVALSPKSHLMTADEIVGIAKQFVDLGITKIRLTGGEPLLRKDFNNIVYQLSELPVKLALTSNGILIDRHIEQLKAAGIWSVNISLDTLKKDRFLAITKRDRFEQAMANIQLLIHEGFHVKVNAVVQKGMNEDEILDFVKWTRKQPIHVRFIEFMPFDGNNWRWDEIVSFKEIVQTIRDNYKIEKLRDAPDDTAKAFRITGYSGTFAIISSMTDHFCNTCSRMRLTANGKIRNCLFSNDEVDLLTAFRNGIDVKPLIQSCLNKKKARHGGITELQELGKNSNQLSKRSMILIGG